ncbi:hypothetical protein FACS189496_3820 [Bacilli bacterium]|nr:hypothetical protein FACS189496_3820 [Bacilli bacterium]
MQVDVGPDDTITEIFQIKNNFGEYIDDATFDNVTPPPGGYAHISTPARNYEIDHTYKYTITGTNNTNVQQTVTASFTAHKDSLSIGTNNINIIVAKDEIHSINFEIDSGDFNISLSANGTKDIYFKIKDNFGEYVDDADFNNVEPGEDYINVAKPVFTSNHEYKCTFTGVNATNAAHEVEFTITAKLIIGSSTETISKTSNNFIVTIAAADISALYFENLNTSQNVAANGQTIGTFKIKNNFGEYVDDADFDDVTPPPGGYAHISKPTYKIASGEYEYTITGTNETNVQQTVTASFTAKKGNISKPSGNIEIVVYKADISEISFEGLDISVSVGPNDTIIKTFKIKDNFGEYVDDADFDDVTPPPGGYAHISTPLYDSDHTYKYTITGTNTTAAEQTVTASFTAIKGSVEKSSGNIGITIGSKIVEFANDNDIINYVISRMPDTGSHFWNTPTDAAAIKE